MSKATVMRISKAINYNNMCRAQITVMATLVFMIVISFVTTCVNAAAMSGYNTVIKQTCSLSDESVFTAYSNDMLRQFDIFALKKSDIINDKVNQYIKTSINTHSKDIQLVNAQYDEYRYMTDNGGYGVEEQIVRYMQSGGYIDVIRDYNSVKDGIKQSDSVSKVSSDIVEVKDTAQESWIDMKQLINVCDNIGDKEDELQQYAKQLVNTVNTLKEEELMQDELDNTKKDIAENVEEIRDAADEIKDMSYKIYDIIDTYEGHMTDTTQQISASYEALERHKEELGDTVYSAMKDDINNMESGGEEQNGSPVDVVEAAVDNDISVLDELLKKSDINIRQEESIDNIINMSGNVQRLCGELKVREVADRYREYIDEDDSKPDINVLTRIYKLFKEGITGLVIDTDISDKTIEYDNLADSVVTGTACDDISNLSIRSALVNEYIISRFQNYTDYIDSENKGTKDILSEDRLLDYETEYILCGGKSDKDNLCEVITKLSHIREGANLLYLITDSQKKNECFTLAVQLLGYTGNMVLIKAAQYLIMTLWAYAESIVELRGLYSGESISIIKNAGDWETDINGLINLGRENISSGSVQWLKNSGKNRKGTVQPDDKETDEILSLDYAGYLRILLLMQNGTTRNARVMSAMELVMVALGHNDFRMKDYIYEADGTATFAYVKNGQQYTQKLSYSYVS
ncbi:putative uncharacterized protein [Eubacterium sp. CAG:252]|nr:putative uncharacterized protein [Eubacterium sp. CAG:252]